MSTDLASLVVTLSAETSKYSAGLAAASKQLESFSKRVDGLVNDLAGKIAAFFAVDSLVEWGKKVLENADHLEKFSQEVGVSVEELSRLQFALTASGVEGDALAGIFRKLNQEISTAAGNTKSSAAVAFNLLGISVQDAGGHLKDADQILSEVANKFSGYADGANKTALAVELFGKQGATLIPLLDQGAAGIQKLKDQSDALGATLSDKTAKAAEEFNDSLNAMKIALVSGVGNQIAANLLPNLNDLAKSFGNAADGGSTLSHVADVGTGALKLLADIGLTVFKTFDDIGTTLGAVGAQIVALFKGNFSEIGDIQSALSADIEASDKKFQDRLNIIWRDGGDKVVDTVTDAANRVKAQAPNLAGGIALQKAFDDSLKRLQDFADALQKQVATFGQAKDATAAYRLTQGDLAKDLANTGAAGQALADKILKYAAALQKAEDTKTIAKGLEDVNAEIAKLSGNSADAAIDDLNKKLATLNGALRRQGDTAGESQVDQLIKLVTATADYNAELQKTQDLQSHLSDVEQTINNERDKGVLNDLQAQQALSGARKQQADDLQAIYDIQVKIAAQTGNPAQIAAVQKLGVQIDTLHTQADQAGQALRKGFEDDLSGPLEDAILKTKSFGDAMADLLDNIAKRLVDLAVTASVQKLFGSIAGSTSNGSGGNIFSSIIGLFAGGAKANGGPVTAGVPYLVGERGPEQFVPNQSGTIIPNGMGGSVIHQQFVIQAPQGTVSRSTQLQLGSAAAKGLATASRRNG